MTPVISVLTTCKVGNWNIPVRGQNFINSHYASINGYKISSLSTHSSLFNFFSHLKSVLIEGGEKKNTVIIFCSALQLMNLKGEKINFINFFKKYEIHFALELNKGKGKKYLNQVFSELDNFSNKKSLSLQESTMRDIKKIKTNKDLFKKYKKKII